MDVEKLIQTGISLFGSVCFICEKPVAKGDKVLSVEKKIGVGILSKTLRYEVHLRPCAMTTRDILTKKIVEAGGA